MPRGSQPWPELITAGTSRAVLREVGRSVQAGELAASGPLERLEDGRWAVPVWRIRKRKVVPRWRKPVLVAGGTVLTLGGLGAAGWWLAGAATVALSAASVPLLVGLGAVLLVLGGILRAATRPSRGGCETTVIIRHRHH